MDTSRFRGLSLAILVFIIFSCNQETNQEGNTTVEEVAQSVEEAVDEKARALVLKAIEAHGGTLYDTAKIEFDFRGRHYVSDRKGGDYQYERIFTEGGKQIRDVLNNYGFKRMVNGEEIKLSEKKSKSYANSVNSVLYFALLPYYLNDPAVRLSYLEDVAFNGNNYHKVKVTFKQEGGGKDFEDEYVYWINTTSFTVDYLAYNYLVDGGGARMREAYNVRIVEGIRFADYVNYKPTNGSRAVATFDQLFEAGKMKALSKIESENVTVSR